MISEQINTRLLVYMMGMSFKMIPYTSHMITEMVAKANISKEMSEADFVFQVFITCGRKVMAEMLPAAIPRSCIDVIIKDNV
jgi:hypothetical protein